MARKAKTKAAADQAGCGCDESGIDDTVAREDMETLDDFAAELARGGAEGGDPDDADRDTGYGEDPGAASADAQDDDDDDGDGLVEDGYDLLTHGGGALETVPGFELFEPMVEGIGETAPEALPEDYDHLPCASSVHFGDGPQETVCGRDDRIAVPSGGVPPWRMICQLIITLNDGTRSRGSGWFISPRSVVTAGHCLHSSRSGGWARSIEVIPGMQGRHRPFGTATSRRFHSTREWVSRANPARDYGCIILPEDQALGRRTGWFGFAALPDRRLRNLLANNSGYPGDKAFGTQWYNAGRITGVERERLAYMFDTAPGQSGSPTWGYFPMQRQRHVVGIHNYGGCANRSTRITRRVFRHLRTWKAAGS